VIKGRDDKVAIHEIDFLSRVSECLIVPQLSIVANNTQRIAQDTLRSRLRPYSTLQASVEELIISVEELVQALSSYHNENRNNSQTN